VKPDVISSLSFKCRQNAKQDVERNMKLWEWIYRRVLTRTQRVASEFDFRFEHLITTSQVGYRFIREFHRLDYTGVYFNAIRVVGIAT
jgi:hypothetical protein